MTERQIGLLLLAVACCVAAVTQAPALTSGFLADDYVYLEAARHLSASEYFRVAFTPNPGDSPLPWAEVVYRPLYFALFWPLERAFGDHPLPYHLLLLAIHFGSIAMVGLFTRRLFDSWIAGGVAGLVFAVHPVPFEAVSWISSLNSIALPLGLGGVLLYWHATSTSPPRRRALYHALAVLLLAAALGFRETSVVFLVAVGAWHVLAITPAWKRETWPRLIELAPYLLLGVLYLIVRTNGFSEPVSGSTSITTRQHSLEQIWMFVRAGFVPTVTPEEDWLRRLSLASGLVVVAISVWAVAMRRWRLTYCLALFVVAAVPFATSPLGVIARYFYFILPFFAAAVAYLAALTYRILPRQLGPAIGAAALFVGAGSLAQVQSQRVETWSNELPAVQEAWVQQLRSTHEEIASDTLCVENTPPVLMLFDALVLQPTVKYYYPDVERVIPVGRYFPSEPLPEECAGQPLFVFEG